MKPSRLITHASGWVQANCPDPAVGSDLIRRLTEAEDKRLSCSFTIGAALTKSGTPCLVHCYAGQLFVFQLTPDQAQRLEIGQKRMRCTEHVESQAADPNLSIYVSLDELDIENGNNLSNSAPITGRCTYSKRGTWLGPFAVGLEFLLKGVGNVLAWDHHTEGIPQPDGVWRFSFPPICECFGQASATWTGTTAVLLRLYTPPSVQGGTPFSNACAALIDVK